MEGLDINAFYMLFYKVFASKLRYLTSNYRIWSCLEFNDLRNKNTEKIIKSTVIKFRPTKLVIQPIIPAQQKNSKFDTKKKSKEARRNLIVHHQNHKNVDEILVSSCASPTILAIYVVCRHRFSLSPLWVASDSRHLCRA